MKLDLLKKLVALANNNPNENEANLSARKVCKMLAADNFKIDGVTKPIVTDKMRRETKTYTWKPEDFYQGAWYSEFKERAKQWQEKEDKNPPPKYKPEDKKYYDRKYARGFGFDTRMLKCKKCGKVKETKFVGLEDVFECNDCIWSEWQRKV